VTVELTDFDTDPMLLNCQNGTLRFIRPDESGPARVELRPHDRADRLTKVTACDYDADAPAPIFQKLVRWAQPDRDRRRYLRQWLGYNLTGDMGEQIFHIWYGPLAANGKSTVGNACREAIGDYGDITNVETFLDEGPRKKATRRRRRSSAARRALPDRRRAAEGRQDQRAADQQRDRRRPDAGARQFPQLLPLPADLQVHAVVQRPAADPAGHGGHLAAREGDARGSSTSRKQKRPRPAEEAEGRICRHPGVDGARADRLDGERLRRAGIGPARLGRLQAGQRPALQLPRLCTEPDPSGRVQSSHLYARLFCAWAKAAGETEWKQKGFSQALKAKGLATKASNGMHWLGIKAIRQPERLRRRGGPGEERCRPSPTARHGDLADRADPRAAPAASAATTTMCRDA
jgi:DNA primase